MNTPELIEVYRRIAAGEEKHGNFLTHFAQAFIRADYENLQLLAPLALCLAKKYRLHPAAAVELLDDQGVEALCTRFAVSCGALGVVMLIVHERGVELVAGGLRDSLDLAATVQKAADELKDGNGMPLGKHGHTIHAI